MRVDNGAGVRQLCLALVMVGDDQVDAQLPAQGRFFYGGDAAVDRDDEPHMLRVQPGNGVAVQAVALFQTAGDVVAAVCA